MQIVPRDCLSLCHSNSAECIYSLKTRYLYADDISSGLVWTIEVPSAIKRMYVYYFLEEELRKYFSVDMLLSAWKLFPYYEIILSVRIPGNLFLSWPLAHVVFLFTIAQLRPCFLIEKWNTIYRNKFVPCTHFPFYFTGNDIFLSIFYNYCCIVFYFPRVFYSHF